MDSRLHDRSARRFGRSAFSLIELLLVMVILVVLAGIVATRFTGRSEQARQAAAKTDIAAIETALDAFEIDNGRFPTSEEGLAALVQQPGGTTNWKGPYLKRGLPTDPWNNPYVYRYPGEQNANSYDLWSLGADGREGGDDVNNWTKQ